MIVQQNLGAESAAQLLFTSGNCLWLYRDQTGRLQGPFTADKMIKWQRCGQLPDELMVCGVTADLLSQPIDQIPASLFQPLRQLYGLIAGGVSYTPLTLASLYKTNVPTSSFQRVVQVQPLSRLSHDLGLPSAVAGTTGGQTLQRQVDNSFLPASVAANLPAHVGGNVPQYVIATNNQHPQPVSASQYLLAEPQLAVQAAPQVQHQLAPGRVVVLQQAPAVQQPGILSGAPIQHVQASQQQSLLGLRQPQQTIVYSQAQPQQLVQMPVAGAAEYPSGNKAGIAAPPQSMQLVQNGAVPSYVGNSASMGIARAGGVQPAVATYVQAKPVLGNPHLLQDLQMKTKDWVPCASNAQAKLYPGAEEVMARLQTVSPAMAPTAAVIRANLSQGQAVQQPLTSLAHMEANHTQADALPSLAGMTWSQLTGARPLLIKTTSASSRPSTPGLTPLASMQQAAALGGSTGPRPGVISPAAAPFVPLQPSDSNIGINMSPSIPATRTPTIQAIGVQPSVSVSLVPAASPHHPGLPPPALGASHLSTLATPPVTEASVPQPHTPEVSTLQAQSVAPKGAPTTHVIPSSASASIHAALGACNDIAALMHLHFYEKSGCSEHMWCDCVCEGSANCSCCC